MLLTPRGSAATLYLTPPRIHTNTLAERRAALFIVLVSLLTLFPADTRGLNNRGVECMHGL